MENQPIARLNFTCNRNWEEMTPVTGGRFCNDCQKKVVDFTGKTNDEIAAYLMSSNTKVCGRFQQTQLASSPPKPVWKRWLSAAAMFAAVFMGIKEASAQKQQPAKKLDSIKNYNSISIGEVVIVRNDANFPGGIQALHTYLTKNIHSIKNLKGQILTTFIIEKDGSLTNIKVIKGLNKEADQEAIRVLKESPKWNPRILYDGNPIRQGYTLPINFENK